MIFNKKLSNCWLSIILPVLVILLTLTTNHCYADGDDPSSEEETTVIEELASTTEDITATSTESTPEKIDEAEILRSAHELVSGLGNKDISLSRDGKTLVWKVRSNASASKLEPAIIAALGGKIKAAKGFDTFNTLLIETEQPSLESLNSIIEFINQIERPERQVYLRVMIAELQVNDAKTFGNHLQLIENSVGEISNLAVKMTSNHDLNSLSVEESVRTGLKLFLVNGQKFRHFIYAQNNNSNFKILSNPQIIATHGKQAKLVIGQDVNVRKNTTFSDDVVSIEYKTIPVGLMLSVTPYLHNKGMVSLDITQSISSLDDYDNVRNLAATNNRLLTTSANIPAGQTVVLGGMIQRKTDRNQFGVPGLSKIPVIGKLFNRANNQEQKIELLVFITPEIADSGEQRQKITAEAAAKMSTKIEYQNDKKTAEPEATVPATETATITANTTAVLSVNEEKEMEDKSDVMSRLSALMEKSKARKAGMKAETK